MSFQVCTAQFSSATRHELTLEKSPTVPVTPVIVDEDSIIPESLLEACQEAHKGGLLASTEYRGFIASMSGYEKNQAYGYGMCFVHLTL